MINRFFPYFFSRWSYDTGFKMVGDHQVPSESVYQSEMSRVISRWFITKSWKCSSNVRSKEDGGVRLDLMLFRSPEAKKRIGFKLTASSNAADIMKHAERRYKEALKLEQYVIINFTAREGTATDFLEHQGVPIYHVVHNQAFDDVKIHYRGATGQKETVQVISPPK